MKSVQPAKHVTAAEQVELDRIKADINGNIDSIIDHGYTGVINEDHVSEKAGSVAIHMVCNRNSFLKEFKKSLHLYDLDKIIDESPEAFLPLFVSQGSCTIGANDLFSMLFPQYSSAGSSMRKAEEVIVDHFQDFLCSV